MDMTTIVLLQEEDQLATVRLDQNNDAVQSTTTQNHQVGALGLDYLNTAAKNAHTVASISPERKSARVSAPAPKTASTPTNPASTPQKNIANVGGGYGSSGGNSPAGNYPAPAGDMDSPQINNANVPPEANNMNGSSGYVNKLAAMIDAMKNDPDDMAEGQIFMQYIQNLSADGLLQPGSQCSDLLGKLGAGGMQALISQLVLQNAEISYFGLYNGEMGNNGALGWLNSQIATIQKLEAGPHGSNAYLDDMLNSMKTLRALQFTPGSNGSSQFDLSHYNSKGTPPYYYYTSPVTGDEFSWDPTSMSAPLSGMNFVIYNMIADGGVNQSSGGTFFDNLDINGFDSTYRMQMFDLICKQYPNDPSIILTLFIMMTYNNEENGDLTGETDQTDRQTYITNQMTPITNLTSQIGTLSQNDALSLANQINQVTALVNSMDSTEGYAANFTSNVYNTFWNTQVTFTPSAPGSKPVTESLMKVYTTDPGDFALAVNSINPPASTPGSPSGALPPTASEALQSITNAFQQANSLVSQQSKTIATLSASTSNLLDQDLKIMNFDVGTSASGGGGIVALESSLVGNQVSH